MKLTELEEEIHDEIRDIFPDVKGLKISFRRLRFTFHEFYHAYVNIQVEFFKKFLGKDAGYAFGHITSIIIIIVFFVIFINGLL